MIRNHIKNAPEWVKVPLRPIRNLFIQKYSSELNFWINKHNEENGCFNNDFYEEILLAMAEETDNNFISDKIIADFGCGPRGSLAWASSAKLRIGIDALIDLYSDNFINDIISHSTIYVKSTEHYIPIPSNFIDVMFTLNAIDHVDSFDEMCDEMIRILKPGGLLIGGVYLEEPATPSEPQTLSEDKIKSHLLNKLEVISYRVTEKGPKDDEYRPFYENKLKYTKDSEGVLWFKARKPLTLEKNNHE